MGWSHTKVFIIINMIHHIVFCQSQVDTLNGSTYLCTYILASISFRNFVSFPPQMIIGNKSTERTWAAAHSIQAMSMYICFPACLTLLQHIQYKISPHNTKHTSSCMPNAPLAPVPNRNHTHVCINGQTDNHVHHNWLLPHVIPHSWMLSLKSMIEPSKWCSNLSMLAWPPLPLLAAWNCNRFWSSHLHMWAICKFTILSRCWVRPATNPSSVVYCHDVWPSQAIQRTISMHLQNVNQSLPPSPIRSQCSMFGRSTGMFVFKLYTIITNAEYAMSRFTLRGSCSELISVYPKVGVLVRSVKVSCTW